MITGTLPDADSSASHFFTLGSPDTVTIQTYSFGGGLLSDATPVSAGGFDPIVSVFQESAGSWILLAFNDDGLCPPGIENPYCGDSTLILDLLPGDYRVVVTASANSPVGPTFADGFTGGGSFAGNSSYTGEITFAADAVPASNVPEPSTLFLTAGAGGLCLLARKHRAALGTLGTLALLTLALTHPGQAIDRVVPPGGDLQGALNAAQLGDSIILTAGATYTGNFLAPPKTGSGWITIRTDSAAFLSRSGRVTPADAPLLPKLVTPNLSPVIEFGFGGHHYKLLGLEFKPGAGIYPYELLNIGMFETSVAQMPHDIQIDRCYLHGDSVAGAKNGIVINSINVSITNSHISGMTSTDQETHAIAGWSGGPYQIVNNYLEASGVSVLFGGAVPTVNGGIVSDAQLLRNHMKKLLSWKPSDPSYAGIRYVSKNLLEIKSAQRVFVDGNVMENSWYPDELGRAIVLAVITEQGRVPWARVEDIRITRNIMKNVGVGLLIGGQDIYNPITSDKGYVRGILLQDNIFTEVLASNSLAGSGGFFAVVHSGVQDLRVIHNTYDGEGSHGLFGLVAGPVKPLPSGFRFEFNLVRNNVDGFYDGAGATGTAALNAQAPGYVFRENALEGASPANYPPNNFFPANLGQIGYANLLQHDLRLTPASPYYRQGSDGKDIGADAASVYQATQGVVTGTGGRCITAITPTNFTFGSSGGTGIINVSAPADCRWMTTISPAWFTITSGFSGIGPGQVLVSVPPYSGATRTTSLLIDGLKAILRQN